MDSQKVYKTPSYQRKASLAWVKRNRDKISEIRTKAYCKKKITKVLNNWQSNFKCSHYIIDVYEMLNIKHFIKYKNDSDIKVLLETNLPQNILVSLDEICLDFLLEADLESD